MIDVTHSSTTNTVHPIAEDTAPVREIHKARRRLIFEPNHHRHRTKTKIQTKWSKCRPASPLLGMQQRFQHMENHSATQIDQSTTVTCSDTPIVHCDASVTSLWRFCDFTKHQFYLVTPLWRHILMTTTPVLPHYQHVTATAVLPSDLLLNPTPVLPRDLAVTTTPVLPRDTPMASTPVLPLDPPVRPTPVLPRNQPVTPMTSVIARLPSSLD